MRAYYNEIDSKAAEWLRELIKAGAITEGDVDERSIEDVCPGDLRGYGRCHFFAGIGAWDYALNLAGWGGGQVWTGSCPCQPYSSAGKRAGFADERHLWPSWFHLIDELRPVTIFGEQVSSKDALPWFDLVADDLEGAGYTVGALDIPACSVGAFHIRQRLYFEASLADPNGSRRVRSRSAQSEKWRHNSVSFGRSASDRLGLEGSEQRITCDGNGHGTDAHGPVGKSGSSFWSDAEWIYCRDGKCRPIGTIEPGPFEISDGVAADLGLVWNPGSGKYTISPLIEKSTARISRLRGYGNTIVPWAAKEFIETAIDVLGLSGR